MKRLLSSALLLLASGAALAQPIQQRAITAINSTPTATCSANSCIVFDMTTQGTAQVQVTGTYTASGGLSLQSTVDGVTWVTVGGSGTFRRLSTGATTATITSGETGIYQLSGDCVGAFACRITALGAVTGTANVSVLTSRATAGGVANISGGAGDASASNQVTGNASLASIDTKTPALGTQAIASSRSVTPATSSTWAATQSGTWSTRLQDGSGNAVTSATRGSERALTVQLVDGSGTQITSFGGSGGTASNFGSATPAAGTATGMSDGTNMQLPRVYDTDSGGGAQYTMGVNLRISGSGGSVEGGTSSNPIRTDPTGTTTQPVSASSLPLPTGAATAANQSTANTSLSNIDTDLGAAADSACGSDNGTCSEIALRKRTNQNLTTINASLGTLNASVNADPNYTTTDGGTSATRGIKILGKGGANDVAPSVTTNTVPVNMSAATTTQHVALSGSTLIRVTAMLLIAGGTTNVTFQYGTGTNCGTGTTALSGPLPLIANAGLSMGSGFGAVFVVPSGQALCLTSSAGVQVSGFISYEQH